MSICIINGPNLNMLGVRESTIYGKTTLQDAIHPCEQLCKENNIGFTHFQNNSEAEIINFIQQSGEKFDYIIANLGAYTHTSVAIRDAFLSIQKNEKPYIIELHVSNIYKREKFRHESFIADIALGVISGFGVSGYMLATRFAVEKLLVG